MPHGIFDEYAWTEWAETLPVDRAPSAEAIAEAARYASRDRVRLHAWIRGAKLAEVAALARGFGLDEACAARDAGLEVTHIRYLSAASLPDQRARLSSFESLTGVEVSGDDWGKGLSPTESASLACLAALPITELDLGGVPRAEDVDALRPTLRRLSLKLQDAPRVAALLERPWPALRALRLRVGTAADTKALAELLPVLPERLPRCETLDLDETSTPAKVALLEAMPASRWIAQLSVLRIHDYKLPADRLSFLAAVPFERLTHLGLGLVRMKPKVADVLARADALRSVRTLEIDAKIGAAGMQKIIEAWPDLREIAVWNPAAESDEEVIDAMGLEAFAARGGVVQRRVA